MIRFGPLELKSNLFLSPLAGYTNLPFRLVVREIGGVDLCTTDLVNARSLLEKNPKAFKLIETNEHDRPLAVQLFGSAPEEMRDAAVWLQERSVASIDINMGCPVRKVVNRSAGAALLTDVPRLQGIVRKMAAASTVPVTAKVRLGWDSASRNVVDVSRALEDAGAAAVAIHARTRAEKFEGPAHWEMIGDAKQAVRIPVIGNGDVRTREDAARMLADTGCDAVMIGRAAFGDPWVFGRLRAFHERGETLPPPTASERLAAGIRHLQMMVADFGEAVASREMRKHVAWYIRGLPHSARVREQVNRTRGVTEMRELLRSYLDELERSGHAEWTFGEAGTASDQDLEGLVAAG
jgi:nifR3 family TIM-barrel protein